MLMAHQCEASERAALEATWKQNEIVEQMRAEKWIVLAGLLRTLPTLQQLLTGPLQPTCAGPPCSAIVGGFLGDRWTALWA